MLRVSLFFFILWIFSVVHLIALDPVRAISQYKLDIWQAERGLEQNSPTVILQDRDGYIWLGTLNGLVRFDGIRFRVFNRENTPRLKDNDIKALAQDSGGTLWIGTREGGLSYLKDGEFRTYSPDDHPELMEIAAIFPEPGTGSLWIGTLNSGLIRFNRGTFTTTTTHDGLPSDRVRAFHRDAGGNLLIATSKGLCIRDASGAITPYPGVDGDFKKYIMSMCKTRNGDLWLGCLDGLYRLRSGKITAYGAADGLPDIKIKCLTQDRDGNLWAGTESGGLVRIKNNHIETFGSKDGLASGFVYAIHEDREGNLWLGTLNGGLHRLRDIPVTPYGTAEGLNHDIVNNVSESPGGDVLVCTNNGLNRLSKGKVALDPTLERQLLSRRVTSVFESRKGYLWIGTDKGLNRYAGGRLEHFNNKKGGLYNYLVQLTEDQKGELLVMTTAAVSRFRDGSFTEIFNIDRVSNKFLTSLHCEPDGTLWIGTAGGGVCRLKGGRLNIYTTREGLVHNEVEWFHRDAGGALYIATRGGLSIREQRGFINYNSQSGLMDSDIRCILEDNAGYLWLGGRIGISRLPKEALKQLSDGTITRLKPLFFNESDGIESPWCNSGVRSKDGRLWFATDKGVIMIDPANIKESPLPPPVVIEEMTVDGEPINLYRLRARGTQASRLVLPPGKQRLQFNYTGLSFVKSHRIRFKHKLEGYDHDWVDAGVARSTIYTSLSPGEYTFRVIAGNSGGVWNDKGASFSFYLKPWFYQTTWFYFLVVLFGLLSAVSFYRFRVRQLKARERELGALVEERTQDLKERNIELETAREKIQRSKDMIEGKNAQLESQTLQLQQQSEKLKELDRVKSRFFANISHEFRTPLTLIMGPLEQVLSDYPDDEKLEKKVDLSLRNSRRLLALINQLLDLSKLDSGKMRLQALKQNILPYLKGLVGSFESLTQQKRLNLSFHSKEEEIILYFDAEKLDRAIINLIANAVKFTPGGGEVIVNAVSRDEPVEHFPSGYLEITVSDTGTGIPPDQLPYIFDRFYQARGSGGGRSGQSKHKGTGIGLALVHEVVGLHHGDVRVESEEGSGARFIVRLPLGSGHLEPEEITGEGNMPGMPIRNGGIPLPDAFEIGLEQEEDENERNQQEPHGKEEENGNDTGKNVILVVEDNPDVRRYIREPLESDYIVKEAANGRSGIEKAKMIIPDLIISDVMMPEADGYELCDTLKKDIGTSHIPIILLTAKASDESVIEGLETGADDYITKPFNPKILLTRIRNLIDLRRGLQERVQREMVLQPTDIEVSSIDQEFMKSLKQVMEANLQDPDFGIDKLTRELYMSRATLNRKIKALTGESTNQFIQSYRIKRAAQLLKANFGNVTEVAFEVGFSSSAYFTKCFKDKFHRLPHAFQAAEGGK